MKLIAVMLLVCPSGSFFILPIITSKTLGWFQTSLIRNRLKSNYVSTHCMKRDSQIEKPKLCLPTDRKALTWIHTRDSMSIEGSIFNTRKTFSRTLCLLRQQSKPWDTFQPIWSWKCSYWGQWCYLPREGEITPTVLPHIVVFWQGNRESNLSFLQLTPMPTT